MNATGDVVYRLNDRDELVFANPAWDRFAAANSGEFVTAERALGRSLWGFISDATTRQLYRDVLRRVRGGRPVRFNFRCDSPAIRRLMEMDVTLAAAGGVEFRTRALSEDSRPFQALLAPSALHSDELMRMCSWCKKVDVGGAWAEVEEAVARLRLFERALLPSITHGICDPCYEGMARALRSP